MENEIYCTFCSSRIPRLNLFEHVEDCRVGRAPAGNFYNIYCGICQFDVPERNGTEMIYHCYQKGHDVSEIALAWNSYMQQEAKRVKATISLGIKLLKENEPSPVSDSRTLKRKSHTINGLPGSFTVKSDSTSCENTSLTPDHVQDHDGHDTKTIGVTQSSSNQASVEIKMEHKTVQENKFGKVSKPDPESFENMDLRKPKPDSAQKHDSSRKKNNSLEMKESYTIASNVPKFDGKRKSFDKCRKCDRLMYNKERIRSRLKRQLVAHGVMHSKLKFIRCTLCLRELGSTYQVSNHSRTKCKGTFESLKTDEKVVALRKILVECFPKYDFELELAHSFVLEPKTATNKMQACHKYKPRTDVPKKGDCHLCTYNKVGTITQKLRHIISHSGIRLYQCNHCSYQCTQSRHVNRHVQGPLGKSLGCSGMISIATKENIECIRRLLSKGFPEYDWEKELPPGTKLMATTF